MQQQSLDEQLSDAKVTVERDAFREALGAVCTPLAIVTSRLAARPHGTTVSAFCSLSLAPPLVLVSLDRTSRLLAMIRTTGRFAINVLEHGQEALATRFATKRDDKFADVAWSIDHGLPRIHGAGSWIACRLETLLEGGDHEIVVGLVEHAEQRARNPLLYQHCTFRRLRWTPLADGGTSLRARDQSVDRSVSPRATTVTGVSRALGQRQLPGGTMRSSDCVSGGIASRS